MSILVWALAVAFGHADLFAVRLGLNLDLTFFRPSLVEASIGVRVAAVGSASDWELRLPLLMLVLVLRLVIY